jgi:hypothetical protein
MTQAYIREDLTNCMITGYDLVSDETVEVEHGKRFESWQPDLCEEWDGGLLINRNGHPTIVTNIDFDFE